MGIQWQNTQYTLTYWIQSNYGEKLRITSCVDAGWDGFLLYRSSDITAEVHLHYSLLTFIHKRKECNVVPFTVEVSYILGGAKNKFGEGSCPLTPLARYQLAADRADALLSDIPFQLGISLNSTTRPPHKRLQSTYLQNATHYMSV